MHKNYIIMVVKQRFLVSQLFKNLCFATKCIHVCSFQLGCIGLGLTNGWKLEKTSVLLMIALIMLGNCFGGIGYDR